jgi:hypothetical protein
MQLIRKLIRNRSQGGRNHKIRGLSTAELIGIIIIVGILGALGGTYIGSLVGTAKSNSIAQNINSLNTVCASMLSGGVDVASSDHTNVTTVGSDTLTAPTGGTLVQALINELNAGYTDATSGVTYKMTPPISAAAITAGTYVPTLTLNGSNVSAITWTQGSTVP